MGVIREGGYAMRVRQFGVVTLLHVVVLSGCEKVPNPVAPEIRLPGAADQTAPDPTSGRASLLQTTPPNIGERQGFDVVPLAPRSSFPDAVDATFRIKLDGKATRVAHVRDPSDAVLIRGTFAEGGSAGWHTHPGPGIIIVQSGLMGVINASDCVLRHYGPGEAFIDPGQGNIHVGFNAASMGETVFFAMFLDVPPGVPVSSPAPDPGCS
jgi:hypothetical protein